MPNANKSKPRYYVGKHNTVVENVMWPLMRLGICFGIAMISGICALCGGVGTVFGLVHGDYSSREMTQAILFLTIGGAIALCFGVGFVWDLYHTVFARHDSANNLPPSDSSTKLP